MRKSFRTIRLVAFSIPLLIAISGMALGVALGITWTRSEVIPVILVKPDITGFVPVEGSSIGNTWRKSEVKPVLFVKPGITGFEPNEGMAIGNTWRKEDILPVMLVEPSTNGFVPLYSLLTKSKTIDKQQKTSDLPLVIQSKIDGDFNGWEGETIVKLINGQIWQQDEYYYHYHYAYMPKVFIFKSGVRFKMKVDGVERTVGVKRLE